MVTPEIQLLMNNKTFTMIDSSANHLECTEKVLSNVLDFRYLHIKYYNSTYVGNMIIICRVIRIFKYFYVN